MSPVHPSHPEVPAFVEVAEPADFETGALAGGAFARGKRGHLPCRLTLSADGSSANLLVADSSWPTIAKLLGMFLLILGGKFWLMRMCSTSLPLFDQWEGEGGTLLAPWLRGELHLADLFAPWVQHRIVWTRLLVLGLFQLNGQWDAQVEMITAAVIHATVAVSLGAILIHRLGRACEDAILLCLTFLFGLPFASENTLMGGFASQYYFLLVFTVVGIWGFGTHRPRSIPWWTGAVCIFLAWFSVATGGFGGLAVAVWMACRLFRADGPRRDNWITLAAGLALGIGGLSLSVGVPQLIDLQPRNPLQFLERFAGLLGWPNPTAWAAPIAFAPFVWFLWRSVRTRKPAGPAEKFLIPLGFFALLHTAALAYARNRYHGLEVPRYMDFLSCGTLVNFCCALLLTTRARAQGPARRALAQPVLLLTIWVVVAGVGLCRLTSRNIARDLPTLRANAEDENRTIAEFIARPNPGFLLAKNSSETATEDPVRQVALLQDAEICRVLPALVRAPIILRSTLASPFIHRLGEPGAPDGSVWVLAPRHDGRPVYFRSQALGGSCFPYLRFPMVSELDEKTCLALVDESSGETTTLRQDLTRAQWQSVLVRTPAGPFHVEAVVTSDAERPLAFYDPREVGWLSAWVDTMLDGSMGFLFSGLALWLAATAWQRRVESGSQRTGQVSFPA